MVASGGTSVKALVISPVKCSVMLTVPTWPKLHSAFKVASRAMSENAKSYTVLMSPPVVIVFLVITALAKEEAKKTKERTCVSIVLIIKRAA